MWVLPIMVTGLAGHAVHLLPNVRIVHRMFSIGIAMPI